jgi:hypothetical protein
MLKLAREYLYLILILFATMPNSNIYNINNMSNFNFEKVNNEIFGTNLKINKYIFVCFVITNIDSLI